MVASLRCGILGSFLLVLLLADGAHGHRVPVGHVPTPEETALYHPRCDAPRVAQALAVVPTRRIIFLNRQGETYFKAQGDNSHDNTSSIVKVPAANVPAYPYDDDVWRRTVDCVKETYAAFSVEITEEDPGDVAHIEVVTGGTPEDIGLESNQIAGVAPGHPCDHPRTVERAIVFTFAAHPANFRVNNECWTIAQEVGHAFGLDHEYLCEDPMTYLDGCVLPKRFQDQEASCGELRGPWTACGCGEALQNSHAHLLTILGPYDPVPPTVSITSPAEGAEVPLGFAVTVEVTDDTPWINKVELWIDGGLSSTSSTKPFPLMSPADLTLGQHTVAVKVYDNGGNVATDSAMVTVVPGCSAKDDCDPGEECKDSACVKALGTECKANQECGSAICASDGDKSVCTKQCAGSSECPDGFACLDAPGGGFDKCFADKGDGCAAGGRRSSVAGLWLTLGALALLALGRRREWR